MNDIPSYNWGNLDSPWLAADLDIWKVLTAGRTPVKYPARCSVFWQGKSFSHIYIVAKGRVRVGVFNEDGQEKQLYTACPGALIGEVACILSQPHVTTAKTITATELYVIPSKEAQRLFHSDACLADMLLQYVARKNRQLIAQTAMLSFDSARQRIAKILLCLCETYGREGSDGVRIDLRFTCTDIAGVVNTSRVTANNELLKFIADGVLEKSGSYYIVRDMERLRQTAVQMMDK